MVVARRHHGANSGKVRRMCNRRQHLRGSHVGTAPHANLSVGVRQRGCPFYGVITIRGLMYEGVKLAVGGITSANILNNHDKSVSGGFVSELHTAALVIGRALQEYRELAIGFWPVDVRTQDH